MLTINSQSYVQWWVTETELKESLRVTFGLTWAERGVWETVALFWLSKQSELMPLR